jgi:DNA polymerase-3 subunit gamma/tau
VPAAPDAVEPQLAAEPEPEPEPQPQPAQAAAPASPPGALDVAGLKRLWDHVLDAVKTRSRTAHALMLSSQIQSLEDSTLTLSFKTPTLATRFANDVADFVSEALKEVAGIAVRVRAVSAEGGPAAAAGSGTAGPAAPTAAPDPEPDEIDLGDPGDTDHASADPSDAALSLVKESLGGQVIGEIDQS